MKIECWSIGKAHDPAIRDAIEDFTSRVSKYTAVKWQILPVPKNAGMLSEIDLKKLEGKMILEWLDKETILVALDEFGKEISSEGLADLIVKRGNMGTKKIVFLIGGAFGIDNIVLERADYRISLSKMTFPHQLVRLILIEQLYRAYTIIKNEKYHHR
jgi:23S rRNA (pseudouridine1915-N3)-methyltransferase